MPRTGRPPSLTPDVAATIVRYMRMGAYIETAAAAAGRSKVTLYEWMKTGARAREKGRRVTAHEQACIDFLNAVDTALAESELEDVSKIATLAQGGRQVTTVREKVQVVDGPNGSKIEQVVERTTNTETLAPSLAALTWRLERRFPDKYGRQRIEVTGADGGPLEFTVEERASALAQEAELFLQGAAEAAQAEASTKRRTKKPAP